VSDEKKVLITKTKTPMVNLKGPKNDKHHRAGTC